MSISFQQWRKALAEYNANNIRGKGGRWVIPKKGTSGYKEVMDLVGNKKVSTQTSIKSFLKKK